MGGDRYVTVQRPADGVGIAKCILSWGLVDRTTGEGQHLPESLAAGLQDRVAVAD